MESSEDRKITVIQIVLPTGNIVTYPDVEQVAIDSNMIAFINPGGVKTTTNLPFIILKDISLNQLLAEAQKSNLAQQEPTKIHLAN